MTTPAPTRAYLVRHCDVHNPGRVLYGHLPNFPLSDKGIRQAHALGEYFQDKPVRMIYASPLERAQQTATIIASYLSEVPIVTTEELVEAKIALYWQGIRPRDVAWRKPHLWLVHKTWPGLLPLDESVAEMAARVEAPLRRLVKEFPGEGGICVSHGDPIQAFITKTSGGHRYLRLDCLKGGRLELDYDQEGRLARKTYRPPPIVDRGAPGAVDSGTGTPESPDAGAAGPGI